MINLIKYFKKYLFEIILISSILFILFAFLYRKITGKKGTWSNIYNYKKSHDDYPQYNPQYTTYFNQSKGEAECRRVLEDLFQRPFKKRRPKFLFNSKTGSNMELDMYNKDVLVACEYNGKQHYEHVPHFHKNKEMFYKQQERDRNKKRICENLGILLIEVPYTVKIKDIRNYIINILQKNGYK